MTEKINTVDSTLLDEPSTANVGNLVEDDSDFPISSSDKNRRKSIIPPTHQPRSFDDKQSSDIESESNEDENKSNFDVFILQNFTLFSGRENVIGWLERTEKKFNELRISRNLRFDAIPLLIEGEAKRKYIYNRKQIQSFDDFYEFLLINYEVPERNTPRTEPYAPYHQFQSNDATRLTTIRRNITFENSNKTNFSGLDLSEHLPPRPILRSTALGDMGTTSLSGDEPEIHSKITPSRSAHTITSNLDETTYVLRKAIVDNLIKNPKTFQGDKEDVKQWLDDLENVFDIAQIPDYHKLDLVPYSLRGEALRWYKNNKSTLNSWKTFVQELKEAFLSPYHEELAFKKLESYTQGINQPIRGFYNEILKLCSEADPTMSESTKLKNLLNKTKPTLQFEIRRKKPITTKQFLEYAKEVEELFQLSNLKMDDIMENTNQTTKEQSLPSITNTPNSNNQYTTISPSNKIEHVYSRDPNSYSNDYNQSTDRNTRNHPESSSFKSSSYRTNQPYQGQSRNTNQPYQGQSRNTNQPYQSQSRNTNQQITSTRNNPPFNPNNNGRGQSQPYPDQYSNTNRPSPRTANTILPPDTSAEIEVEPEVSLSIFCSLCHQVGHEDSACQNF
jgi:hypothetical protein